MKKVSCFFDKFILIFASISLSIVMILISYIATTKFCFPICYREFVYKYASINRLEPAFVFAIINTESGFNSRATSNKGAIGLMQLMPTTATAVAEGLGVVGFDTEKLYSPEINIALGCNYLSYLFNKFNTIEEVLFAYNAGEGRLRIHLKESGGVLNVQDIEINETRNFIKKVMKAYRYYLNYL